MNTVIGIFILFIGLHEMTTHLQSMPWEADNVGFNKWTKHPLACIAIAMLTAFLLQSSTTAVLFVIGLVAGRRLSVQSAYFMLLGINLGTAIQWPVLRFPVFVLMMLTGILSFTYRLIRDRGKYQKNAAVAVGVALIFIGLHLIQGSLSDVTHQLWMQESIRQMAHPWQGFVQGFFWTSALTSSGLSLLAFEGIAATTTRQALFYVMGANVGTSTTGIICTLASGADAKRIALTHAILNSVTSVIVGAVVLLLPSTTIASLSSAWPNPFHVLFNVILLVVGLVLHRQILGASARLIPENKRVQDQRKTETTISYEESLARFEKSLWSYFRLLYLWFAKEGEGTTGRLVALEKSIDESHLQLQNKQHSFLIICDSESEAEHAFLRSTHIQQFWETLKGFGRFVIDEQLEHQENSLLQHLLQREMKHILDRYYASLQGNGQQIAKETLENSRVMYERTLSQSVQHGHLSMGQGQMYAKAWQMLEILHRCVQNFEIIE